MQPLITLITLGVDDLERALRFYRDGLGWPTDGIVGTEFEHGAVAFFGLEGGLGLALWQRTDIAWDTGLPVGPRSPAEIALAHNVRSRDQVDQLLVAFVGAGGSLVKPAGPTFYGGYAGYAADPDGHLWEIAFNPELLPPE
jgi:catechol 2,3-dioxygenase-like lactoylglutathione lyase family enzyme